jgi:DNA-directed RNA polymerase I, II, and III subunit RPABC1
LWGETSLKFCLILICTILLRLFSQEKGDDESNQLFVFFPEDEKVGVKPIKIYTDRMRAEGVSNAIMVLRVDITPFAKQAVQEMSDSFRLEHFKESELLVDVS